MIRPGCRIAHFSLAGWMMVIVLGWIALWLCAAFWPGWTYHSASPMVWL